MRMAMDGAEFVDAIKKVVRDAAFEDSLKLLENPPGRRPSERLQRRADWYRTLSPLDKEFVRSALSDAVDAAVFGMLSVIDGVRVVENGAKKGNFELHYVKEGREVLAGPGKEMLHDLYKIP
jgi:hypothetical protein